MKYSRVGVFRSNTIMALAALSILLAPQVQAKNTVKEFAKYFNPLPQKNYLNESQDRLIKKQKFKAGESAANITPIINGEQGLFAIVPIEKISDTDFAEKLLANEKCSGVSVLIPWSTLEPSEEKYNWAPIDGLLAMCQKHNKTMILRISTSGVDLPAEAAKPSSDTPGWVFENGAKSVKYVDQNKVVHLMPVFWDQTYLASFSNFINEMGSRYDKNMLLHSVGITGGGFRGGTAVVPTGIDAKSADKTATNDSGFTSVEQIEESLRKDHGMTQKQIVDHWKYVADLFPQAFPNTRLNFAINPPTPNRAGEDALDEISDYLLFRYGERIYVTRQDLKSGKHGFDDYRVELKFRPDTYAGVSLLPDLANSDIVGLSKWVLDDGISFVELPVSTLENADPVISQALTNLSTHLGFQIISEKASIPSELFQGDSLKAEFSFLNVGDTSPKRPVRELDKDVASSYKVMIELKDSSGQVVARILHTPEKKTESWKTGETITWQQTLKMPQVPDGEYDATASLYDPTSDKKLKLLDGRNADKKLVQSELPLGKLRISARTTADKTITH